MRGKTTSKLLHLEGEEETWQGYVVEGEEQDLSKQVPATVSGQRDGTNPQQEESVGGARRILCNRPLTRYEQEEDEGRMVTARELEEHTRSEEEEDWDGDQDFLDWEEEEATRRWQEEERQEERLYEYKQQTIESVEPTYDLVTDDVSIHQGDHLTRFSGKQRGCTEGDKTEVLDKEEKEGTSRLWQERARQEVTEDRVEQQEGGHVDNEASKRTIAEKRNSKELQKDRRGRGVVEGATKNKRVVKECVHGSYDLESYEMVESTGYHWMRKETTKKECDKCKHKHKLTRRHPMFYCRVCHDHRICNECWITTLLLENDSGNRRRKRQCQGVGIMSTDPELRLEEQNYENDDCNNRSVQSETKTDEQVGLEALDKVGLQTKC
jgi:hypothetical protein